ncbi:hypothetical protein ACFLQ7_03190, partial [Actinomycetota bacterium]
MTNRTNAARHITAVFADDRVVRIDRPGVVWFLRGVTGVDRRSVDQLADDGNGEAFCATNGDALIVRITSGSRPSVTAWKALFSSHELFWTMRPSGDVVVADHYRNIMA